MGISNSETEIRYRLIYERLRVLIVAECFFNVILAKLLNLKLSEEQAINVIVKTLIKLQK